MVDLLRQFLHNSAPSSFPGFLVEVSLKIPLNRPVFKEKMNHRAVLFMISQMIWVKEDQ